MKERSVNGQDITSRYVIERCFDNPHHRFTINHVLSSAAIADSKERREKVAAFIRKAKCLASSGSGNDIVRQVDLRVVRKSFYDPSNFDPDYPNSNPNYCTSCPVKNCLIQSEAIHRYKENSIR